MIIVDNDEWRMAKCIKHLEELDMAGRGSKRKSKGNLEHKDLQNPDYLIADKVGVERATINDFVQKMKARKVEAQLQRVADKGYQPVLLVEGIMPSHTKMPLESIYGCISSISESGIVVIHTISAKHTAKHLWGIHKKILNGEWNILKVPVSRSNADHPTLKKLMGTPGVDEELAKRMQDKFKSMKTFLWACERQLETGRSKLIDVHGIGKVKAQKIAEDWVRKW